MQLSKLLAGFSPGQADTLRKIMGKKKEEELAEMEELFLKGCADNNLNQETAQIIWENWKNFAKYAFNKSHSAAYSYVSFQTAYLKAHYPKEFMAANLQVRTKKNDLYVCLKECKRLDIKIQPPDINSSDYDFLVTENGEIVFGLKAINNISKEAMRHLVAEREKCKDKRFTDLADFVQRMGSRHLNKATFRALILSGALDSITQDGNRAYYLQTQYKNQGYLNANSQEEVPWFEMIIQLVRDFEKLNQQGGGVDLYGNQISVKLPDWPKISKEFSEIEQLLDEHEALGIYLTKHPLEKYSKEMQYMCNTTLSQLDKLIENQEIGEYKAAGIVRKISSSEKKGKSGTVYTQYEIIIDDLRGSYTFHLRQDQMVQFADVLQRGKIVGLTLKIDNGPTGNFRTKVIIDNACLLDQDASSMFTTLNIGIDVNNFNQEQLACLQDSFCDSPGSTHLTFTMHDEKNARSVNCVTNIGKN